MSSFLRSGMRARKKAMATDGKSFQSASCVGKMRYLTFVEAQRNIPFDANPAKESGRLHPYKCTFCNGYHVGRSFVDSGTKPARKLRAALLEE